MCAVDFLCGSQHILTCCTITIQQHILCRQYLIVVSIKRSRIVGYVVCDNAAKRFVVEGAQE